MTFSFRAAAGNQFNFNFSYNLMKLPNNLLQHSDGWTIFHIQYDITKCSSRNYNSEVRLIVSFPDSCQLGVGPVLLTLNTRFRLSAAHLYNFTVRRSQLPWAMKTAARVWVNINFAAKKCRHPLFNRYTVDTLAKHLCIYIQCDALADYSIYNIYIYICVYIYLW